MTEPNRSRDGWVHVKKHTPPVLAAALMYGGISQILSVLQYVLPNYLVKLINLIIRQGFRDQSLLADSAGAPWVFHIRIAAFGVIVMVVGMFVGLWANARSERQPAP